ncbi:MAG: tRNA-dihydrouridine synthase, partial [Deltaproteobacteria bacterium]|nr:tRNA-dihydrouridine synthase [Deltaproteobacteria bacterium]
PVKKVVKTGAGAALLRDPGRARTIIHAMRGATALPLTVKIRSGWDAGSINVVMIARIAEGEGADAVIVHPRTALQSFSGEADWRRIAEVKQEIRIPVIGNGDIRTAEDPLRMIKETGCDAVMIGRAVLGNPWLFRHAGDFFDCGCCRAAPQAGDRGKVIFDHLKMNEALYGREHGLRRFRSHLLWYTKGLPGGVRFRKEAQAIEDRDGLMRAIDGFLASFS